MSEILINFFQWCNEYQSIFIVIVIVGCISALTLGLSDKSETKFNLELDNLKRDKKHNLGLKESEDSNNDDEFSTSQLIPNHGTNRKKDSLDELVRSDSIINKYIETQSSHISSIISIIPLWIGDLCFNGAMQDTETAEILGK